MKQTILFLATLLILCAKPELARSFCGFYVAKADTKIFNKASQVVLARQDDKTVITMVNDFKGRSERVCRGYTCSDIDRKRSDPYRR